MLILLLSFLFCCSHALRERIIIDADASAFASAGFGVDDDLALLCALGSSKLHILGITATYGNTDLSSSISDMNTILSFTQPQRKKNDSPIQVYPGADWSLRNLSHSTEAVQFMAKTLKEYPKDTITLLCLGSLTNLATLITLHPNLALKLRVIVISAGREGGFELNLFAHPEATKLVLETPIPKLVLFPSTMHNLAFSAERIAALEHKCCTQKGKAVCEILPSMKHSASWHSRLFNRLISSERPVQEGFYPFSLVTVLLLLNTSQFEQSTEIHMQMIPSDSFLEEPELKILTVLPSDFARRRVFENLVLKAGKPLDVENVFSELFAGLCSAGYNEGTAGKVRAPTLVSGVLGLRGLLVPAWCYAHFLCACCFLAKIQSEVEKSHSKALGDAPGLCWMYLCTRVCAPHNACMHDVCVNMPL